MYMLHNGNIFGYEIDSIFPYTFFNFKCCAIKCVCIEKSRYTIYDSLGKIYKQ